jgi:hypothetical protein
VPFEVDLVDITKPENSTFFDKYQFDIPAAEIDGEGVFIHRFNEETTMQSLRKWASKQP